MCGIAWLVYDKPTKNNIIKSVCDLIKHRGPDDSGYLGLKIEKKTFQAFYDKDGQKHGKYIEDNHDYYDSYFGHRRLAINDLSQNGHQPLIYRNRYIIIFNGEIYNFKELKAQLRTKGYEFNTETDTEVIPAAYNEWGVECLNRFNGMWAFVMWDLKRSNCFISRDRFGIKPLHFTRKKNCLAFASEIKAFQPLINFKPSYPYLKNYLNLGAHEFGWETAFENIFRFPKASYFLGKKKDLRSIKKLTKKFWSPTVNCLQEPFIQKKADDLAKVYKEKLYQAVKLRLRADVKIGSALSGGLDSSSIVALINQRVGSQQKKDKQVTFSTVYKKKGLEAFDESKYIEKIARLLKVKSYQIEPKIEDILEEHKKMIYHLDTPPNATMMSSWHTYSLVKSKGVTVTLDGQGADELLAGYYRYLINHIVHFKGNIKEELKFIEADKDKKPYRKAGMNFRIIKKLGGNYLTKFILYNREVKAFMALNERLKIDLDGIFNNLLHYADRTSMAFSIESRVPFLDYKLVEFLLEMPACYKINQGWTKYIARKSFEGILPSDIVWRKDKMGWPIPEKEWFNNDLKEPALEAIRNSALVSSLSHKNPERLLKEDIGRFVRLYNLAIWDKTFINT